MDAPDLDADELFLDAVEAVVLAALERIGADQEARFRFFKRLLAVAQEEAGSRCLSQAAPSIRPTRGLGLAGEPVVVQTSRTPSRSPTPAACAIRDLQR